MSEEKVLTPQEQYLNHYVDILKQNLNQQILSNISLQASAKVNNDILIEWQKENDSLKNKLEEINSQGLVEQDVLKQQIEQLKNDATLSQSAKEQEKNAEIDKLKGIISGKDDLIKNVTTAKDDVIKKLQTEINNLNLVSSENEKIKHQLAHIDTFRNELIKTQKLVEDKNIEIQNVINEKNTIINDLNQQIEYLKLTPAKRKKIDAVNKPEVVLNSVEDLVSQTEEPQGYEVALEEITKDGGTF
jgi:vacuolar-type H+-ATPase subunit I/STV1